MDDLDLIVKRIDSMDTKIDKNKDCVDNAISKLTEQVTILVTELKGFPRYTQPCKFFESHLAEHKDWRKTLAQWIGGIIAGIILLVIGTQLK